MLLDEYRGLGLADLATCDTEHQIFDGSSVGLEPARVQTEKGQKGHKPDTLVPVYERVISHNVEEISRCHLVEAFMQEPPFEGRGGSSECGLQEAEIPDAWPPSVSLDLVRVECDHLIER